MANAVVHGPWVTIPNVSADLVGSIHHDEQARTLGFPAALVGGSVLVTYMTPAAIEMLGPAWYERGFLKQTFVAPVHETDTIRLVMEVATPTEHDERLVMVGLEKEDGQRATVGYVGLARSADDALAPWQRSGEPAVAPPPTPDADPVPGEPVGASYPPLTVSVTPEESTSRRSAVRDTSRWYTEASPWGGPIVPTVMYMLVYLGDPSYRPESANRSDVLAGMNSTFQLLQTGPMFATMAYELRPSMAEKGFSGRTAFRTYEFAICDKDGRRLALARQKVRWFASG